MKVLMGKSSLYGPFSMAMFNNQRVNIPAQAPFFMGVNDDSFKL